MVETVIINGKQQPLVKSETPQSAQPTPAPRAMTSLVKPTTPAKPSAGKKMSLAAVTSGKVEEPFRITLMGLDGVGKSTFAANAPSPIFIDVEGGSSELSVARFPKPVSWQDILDAVETLRTEEHPYKTLAVDTLDHAESMLWEDVCRKAGKATIEEVGGGYGKGYLAALDGWRLFLAALERLQREKRMSVILIAHSFITRFGNPEGDDFDRWTLKLHAKSSALIREWSKVVLFAANETFAVKEKGKTRARGISTGARLLYTQRTAAYDAKDRYGLPAQLPLDWASFESAARQGADPVESMRRIESALPQLSPENQAKVKEALARAGEDRSKLTMLANWSEANLPPPTEQSPQVSTQS